MTADSQLVRFENQIAGFFKASSSLKIGYQSVVGRL
jgi:hypothetical protein